MNRKGHAPGIGTALFGILILCILSIPFTWPLMVWGVFLNIIRCDENIILFKLGYIIEIGYLIWFFWWYFKSKYPISALILYLTLMAGVVFYIRIT